MKLYKLTDKYGKTRNDTQWGEGVTHAASGRGTNLCSDGFIHAYEHPLIALLMNPAHAGFDTPRLWEAEGDVVKRDGQTKCGCRSLTTVRELPLPIISTEQRIAFAIRCALAVYHQPFFEIWANQWLDDTDRSRAAARTAAAEAAAERAEAAEAAEAALRAAEAAAAAVHAAAAATSHDSVNLDLITIAETVCPQNS